ncbi:hypothetical protein KM043_006984 [Ampulex compressa]|nr:hypothetical protein KM043_006984 [Ampulex compressa]
MGKRGGRESRLTLSGCIICRAIRAAFIAGNLVKESSNISEPIWETTTFGEQTRSDCSTNDKYEEQRRGPANDGIGASGRLGSIGQLSSLDTRSVLFLALPPIVPPSDSSCLSSVRVPQFDESLLGHLRSVRDRAFLMDFNGGTTGVWTDRRSAKLESELERAINVSVAEGWGLTKKLEALDKG